MSSSTIAELAHNHLSSQRPKGSEDTDLIAANLLRTQQHLLACFNRIYDHLTYPVDLNSDEAVRNIRHLRAQLDALQYQLPSTHRLWHCIHDMPQELCVPAKAVINSLRPATFKDLDGRGEVRFILEPYAICLNDYRSQDLLVQAPTCGHVFHHACLLEAYRQSNRCPVCRHEVDTVDDEYDPALRLARQRQQCLAKKLKVCRKCRSATTSTSARSAR